MAYLENIHLSKEEMWRGKEQDTYSFLVLERPSDADEKEVFNEKKFREDMMDVLELRPLADPTVGVAATAFIRTDDAHQAELEHILHLDMHDYMTNEERWKMSDQRNCFSLIVNRSSLIEKK